MSGDAARVQQIFKALVERQLAESLGRVHEALAAWRRGDDDVMGAHGEVLRHAARSGVVTARVARAGVDGPETLLRDAFDLGLIDRDEFRRLAHRDPGEVAPSPPLDDEIEQPTTPRMPAKRNVMEKFLADGPVLVHLDPRQEGVDVPSGFRTDASLVLRFGYGLSPPIADMTLEADQLIGTLTFRGVPHRCVIPWSSVYAIVADDRRALVWPEDVPAEVAHQFAPPRERGGSLGPEDPPPEPPKPKRGHLRLV